MEKEPEILCPLIRGRCQKERCKWYVVEYSDCALHIIGANLPEICSNLSDINYHGRSKNEAILRDPRR